MGASRWRIGVILLFAAAGCTPKAKYRPNIVLISVDTLAAGHMSLYGYDRPTTPFIDRLSREAVIFENARSQAPHTTPSHYSIFTGRYPQNHKVFAEYNAKGMKPGLPPLGDSIPTLTQYLKAEGYKTYWAGALLDHELAVRRGMDRGFDSLTDAFLQWHRLEPAKRLLLEKLGAAAPGPFFFFIHTYMVHSPYCTGATGAREPKVDCPALVEAALKRKPHPLGFADPFEMDREFDRHFDTSKPEDVRRLVALYDGGVGEADRLVQAIVERLKTMGVFENTVLILTSDHGEAFGEHGQFKHVSAYREILNIPLLIKVPGRPARRVQDEALSIDIVPTVLQLLAIKASAPLDGISLLPSFEGRRLNRRGPRFAFSLEEGAVWEDGLKLVVMGAGTKHLFNQETDPRELHDIAAENPQAAERLSLKLNAARIEAR